MFTYATCSLGYDVYAVGVQECANTLDWAHLVDAWVAQAGITMLRMQLHIPGLSLFLAQYSRSWCLTC